MRSEDRRMTLQPPARSPICPRVGAQSRRAASKLWTASPASAARSLEATPELSGVETMADAGQSRGSTLALALSARHNPVLFQWPVRLRVTVTSALVR